MTGDLKIKVYKDPVTGEVRVPPEVMNLLIRMAEHRDICDQCGPAWHQKTGDYCATGQSIMDEIIDHPTVEFIPKV